MIMPGFTAESSLYEARVGYDMRPHGTTDPVHGVVHPAFRPSCMTRCLADAGDDPYAFENCHCICYGHPGKTCWLQ